MGDIRTSCTRRGTAAAQVPATTHVDKKEEEFSHLFGLLQRVDVNRQVLLETINDDRLDDMEASFVITFHI